ncbi:tripartite tricarboxylate transporter TctB family protein [Amorphus coralli]|uniref:tripartite tricarboxylate transporter TctB family protein n=1 Tax=Amorphus coralli TaxID=340680 RepID=UPI0003769F9B|nr:tripartite tricarboxylate transporter TctB family protein [Amorphus coralli]
MQPSEAPIQRYDWPGALVAVASALLALYVLRESAGFSLFGSVFPRAVAFAMLALAAALLVRTAIRKVPASAIRSLTRANWRTAGLIAVVACWMLLVRFAGFYPASVFGFLAAGALARHTPWTLRELGIHALVSVVTVSAFYAFFAYGLSVRF